MYQLGWEDHNPNKLKICLAQERGRIKIQIPVLNWERNSGYAGKRLSPIPVQLSLTEWVRPWSPPAAFSPPLPLSAPSQPQDKQFRHQHANPTYVAAFGSQKHQLPTPAATRCPSPLPRPPWATRTLAAWVAASCPPRPGLGRAMNAALGESKWMANAWWEKAAKVKSRALSRAVRGGISERAPGQTRPFATVNHHRKSTKRFNFPYS